jgi:tRNA A37 methylthiotransferase MiaB
MEFLADHAFGFMEVFAYHEREGTEAAAMNQVEFGIREQRGAELLHTYLETYSACNEIPFEQLLKQTAVFNTNINFKSNISNGIKSTIG